MGAGSGSLAIGELVGKAIANNIPDQLTKRMVQDQENLRNNKIQIHKLKEPDQETHDLTLSLRASHLSLSLFFQQKQQR
jgi:hypothetical protein